jgi:hypothetical protein
LKSFGKQNSRYTFSVNMCVTGLLYLLVIFLSENRSRNENSLHYQKVNELYYRSIPDERVGVFFGITSISTCQEMKVYLLLLV